MISSELEIHPLRARRTLWRAISGLKSYCRGDLATSPSCSTETSSRSVSSTTRFADDPHTALNLLEQKPSDWAGWAHDADLVQLLLEIASCTVRSQHPQPVSKLGTTRRWTKLLERLASSLSSSLHAFMSAQSQPAHNEMDTDALSACPPNQSAADEQAEGGTLISLSRACSVLYALASLVSVSSPSAACTSTAATAESWGTNAHSPVSSRDRPDARRADHRDQSEAVHKLAEVAAEACCMHLNRAMRARQPKATQNCIADTMAEPASLREGSSATLPGASMAAMACNMLWSLGMLQQHIQPAIASNPRLARQCVACLSDSVETQDEATSQLAPLNVDSARERGGILRQLCSYSTTAGKFISMAMYGASKLDPSIWASGSEQQKEQQLTGRSYKLATLFAKIEALCAEHVDCRGMDAKPLAAEAETVANSSSVGCGGGSGGSVDMERGHKRRRLSPRPCTVKMLELSTKESAMLQEAKEILPTMILRGSQDEDRTETI